MRRDNRLSRTLHVLIHMADQDAAVTSDAIAEMLGTQGPGVRRMMGGLREAGIVTSTKGHGGGWRLTRPLAEITMLDIYAALGEPAVFAMGPARENPTCLVEQAVDARLGVAFDRAAALLRAELQAASLADIADDFERRLAAHTGRPTT
ncbi:RrF2 family transcriptional regulator [Pseudaestuariivita sp.]|uniref:RrF2 family transcriptional regulator n=1 Tax=Pseudaestuariivita sp. TaxID=2211669 RepID=UPI00405883A1